MMKNPKSKILNPKSGFTIIESLVAIAILVIIIVGASTAVSSGLSSYIFSKDQIVAFYLAQEGFEELRNIRDENALNGRSWLTGIASGSSDPCYFGHSCMASPVESSVLTRCSGACLLLRQEAGTGFFGYNIAWPETIFRREISLSSIGADEVAVTVTVSWSKGATTREFEARENLLKWQ